MRWLFLTIGGLATAAMLLISMRLNFLFGSSLGQTPERARVFGCVSVISDAWKLEAAITALLLRPVESNQRIRGTVAEVSANCQRADARTTEACGEISQLRKDLAAANEEHDLDRRLSELTSQARQLRERGAMKAADPQAELLSRLSGGPLSPHDVGPALSLLLARTIELVSAFGPTVLSNYAEATERSNGERRDKPADRVAAAFVAEVDRLRVANDLGDVIRKRKDRYCGIRLVVSP
jgi:hypothetical protein